MRRSSTAEAIAVALAPPRDVAGLADDWRALRPSSFFQSWAWVSAIRFSDPVLLRATAGGRTVALALFNRRGRVSPVLHLHETGDAALDRVFVEHNGIAVAPDAPAGTKIACWTALRGCRVTASGIGDDTLAAMRAAGLPARVAQTRLAPVASLAGAPTLDATSANTRQQVRRSMRLYAEAGALRIERADTRAVAHDWLARLAVLHQATWIARGKPGAFANPAFLAFHRAVIDEGFAGDEIDLLRVSTGERPVGYLYNFRRDGRASAYQSGFDYPADARQKPGLVCHHLAMEWSQTCGATAYDFLAGDDRYKRSLAGGTVALHWARSVPIWSPTSAVARTKALLRR